MLFDQYVMLLAHEKKCTFRKLIMTSKVLEAAWVLKLWESGHFFSCTKNAFDYFPYFKNMGSKHGWSHSLPTFFNDTSKAEQNNVEAELLGHGPLNPLQNQNASLFNSSEHTRWNQTQSKLLCKGMCTFNY